MRAQHLAKHQSAAAFAVPPSNQRARQARLWRAAAKVRQPHARLKHPQRLAGLQVGGAQHPRAAAARKGPVRADAR